MMNDIELFLKLKESANYHFSNEYLPFLFFLNPEAFDKCMNDQIVLDNCLKTVIAKMKNDGYLVKDLNNTRTIVVNDEHYDAKGIIFEIPNAEYECECNYVCIVKLNGELKYFESEYYESGRFGLCGRDLKGHYNYGDTGGDIRTAEDMWDAILVWQEYRELR